MALSEREERVLEQIEQDLAQVSSSRLSAAWDVLVRWQMPIVLTACALATVILFAVFTSVPAAGPLAATWSVAAGYQICAVRHRTSWLRGRR